jgi:hypothetical protein
MGGHTLRFRVNTKRKESFQTPEKYGPMDSSLTTGPVRDAPATGLDKLPANSAS